MGNVRAWSDLYVLPWLWYLSRGVGELSVWRQIFWTKSHLLYRCLFIYLFISIENGPFFSLKDSRLQWVQDSNKSLWSRSSKLVRGDFLFSPRGLNFLHFASQAPRTACYCRALLDHCVAKGPTHGSQGEGKWVSSPVPKPWAQCMVTQVCLAVPAPHISFVFYPVAVSYRASQQPRKSILLYHFWQRELDLLCPMVMEKCGV